ncbi:TPA: protein kinase, partial [Escherichia coli]|nr:protein kinase [Escherichia coli]
MAKRFRRMSDSDINTIVADLDRWAMGELGSKLTWAVLEERFGFSRQSLQAKSEIKAAYDNAKRALSGGLVKTKEQATK